MLPGDNKLGSAHGLVSGGGTSIREALGTLSTSGTHPEEEQCQLIIDNWVKQHRE